MNARIKKYKSTCRPCRPCRNFSHLFPHLNDDLSIKLKIDDDSLRYISTKDIANKITNIIISHLSKNPKEIIITDATAGVGGNTISFAMYFNLVNSIELDTQRAKYLQNNINIYGLTNVKIYNDDCNKVIPFLKQNIVFIDPPWGGTKYKNYKNLRLLLSGIHIPVLCNNIFDPIQTKYPPSMIVLKLPKNYDIKHLFNSIPNCNMFLYELEKMCIIIIIKL